MNFNDLRAINVSDHIETKGRMNYLSWTYAVDELLQRDPSATWVFGEPQFWNGTVMVFCSVTAFGKTMTAQLPVMDYRNDAIENPDAVAVNKAMQRCLVKAIALHGIGLYIYAGEDLPEASLDEYLKRINCVDNIDDLKTVFADAWKSLPQDQKEKVKTAYDEKKRELIGE